MFVTLRPQRLNAPQSSSWLWLLKALETKTFPPSILLSKGKFPLLHLFESVLDALLPTEEMITPT